MVHLEPGQFVFGRKELAMELGTTERKIRTAIDLLKKAKKVTIKSTNKFSIGTIVEWKLFHSAEIPNDQQTDQHLPTNDQQTTTNKKDKIDKKVKYMDFVLLKPTEYDTLLSLIGLDGLTDYIERVNDYIGSKGKQYKSHYHTIRAWWRKDQKDKKPEDDTPQERPKPELTVEEAKKLYKDYIIPHKEERERREAK